MASAIPFFFLGYDSGNFRVRKLRRGWLFPVGNPDIFPLVGVLLIPAAFGFRSLQQVNVAACVSLVCQVSRPVRRRLLSLFH